MMSSKALADCRVLIVDDTKANIDVLVETLRDDYKLSIATDGERALRSIEKAPPDIVLLDIMMPGIDGYEVCRRLKAVPETREIPVIFLSALNEVKDKTTGFEAGAADYVTKPFETAEVKARVRAHLQLKMLRDQERIYLQQIEDEKARSEQLLLNILPKSIADRLKQGETTIADGFKEVSILFADLAGFTGLSTRVPPDEIVAILNRIFSAFDDLAERYGLEKIKTIGDCYMAASGLPVPRADHAEAMAEMALAMLDVMREPSQADLRLNLRIGINSGPVVAGIIGNRKFIYDLWGDAVNTANRMESHGLSNRVQVSEATHDLLKGKYLLEARGEIEVAGKGPMNTFWLNGRLA
jgi:class 3 adenylate cyclase